MTGVLNICKGWGCGVTQYCEKGRYYTEAERDGAFVHEFIPTQPGENCPEYEVKRKRRWGDGGCAED